MFFLGKEKVSDEPVALEALLHFGELAPKGFPLVPEHVETRPLYNPEKPGMDMVRLFTFSNISIYSGQTEQNIYRLIFGSPKKFVWFEQD